MDFTCRLAGLLHLTRIDEARYTALRRHGNLPFFIDDLGGKWQKFSRDDAVRLRVMLDLMGEPEAKEYGQGLPPALASKIVGNGMIKAFGSDILAEPGSEIWLGVLMTEAPLGDAEKAEGKNPERSCDWYAGTLSDLAPWVAGKAPHREGCNPVRVFLVNLTRAAKDVEQRAVDFGLLDNRG